MQGVVCVERDRQCTFCYIGYNFGGIFVLVRWTWLYFVYLIKKACANYSNSYTPLSCNDWHQVHRKTFSTQARGLLIMGSGTLHKSSLSLAYRGASSLGPNSLVWTRDVQIDTTRSSAEAFRCRRIGWSLSDLSGKAHTYKFSIEFISFINLTAGVTFCSRVRLS